MDKDEVKEGSLTEYDPASGKTTEKRDDLANAVSRFKEELPIVGIQKALSGYLKPILL
jgi:hypothetical protein